VTLQQTPERRPKKIDLNLLPAEFRPVKKSKLSLILYITIFVLVCAIAPLIIMKSGVVVSSGTVTSNTNPQLTLNFSWSIPEGANGNYTISFKNNNSYFTVSTFDSHGNGDCCSHNNNFASAVFSGDGAINRTWVAIGKQIGGQVYSYQDYMITATAKKNGQNIVSITAVVRHSPGPLAWWQEQTVVIPSWQVYYY